LPGRIADVAAVLALATLVTAALAAPVLRAPSERVFGREIVGRHHDPFTVMEQFGRPFAIGVYSQPATDGPGALLARAAGPVAAYNWLVLITFPLSALAAYLLARHLALSPPAAVLAAFAFAFSPFHLAHAAYHPHVAQVQWLPLYLLALWRCVDRPSPPAIALLAAASTMVVLSNFYGGLIAAVMTPVALAAYWVVTRDAHPRPVRRLAITAGSLGIIAAAGLVYVMYAAGSVLASPADFAFPRDDLFRYSAKWWGYLVPPAAHPLMGAMAHRVWDAAGVREGLLEHQVSLGWGIVALGIVAVLRWPARLRRGGDSRRQAALVYVPALAIVAFVALLCSLSPERTVGAFTFARPSALLYDVVPMFRSYARFGVIVQLMAALLAGIGVDALRRAGWRGARAACLVLVAIAAAEYAVSPRELWRPVLPTTAHYWVLDRPGEVRALDCTPADREGAAVEWLTRGRITLVGNQASDCTEPGLPGKLAALGFTHLLVRRGNVAAHWFERHADRDGLQAVATFDDGRVFAIMAPVPAVYTAAVSGLSPREHDRDWTWRWMGGEAAWTIVNTTTRPVVSVLSIELSAFHRARVLEVLLDSALVQRVVVDPLRRTHQVGPISLAPGRHELRFRPADAPAIAHDVIGNGDQRALSFAVGRWEWIPGSEER
jgi:hypothetical protein